jgi:hypothetical protein
MFQKIGYWCSYYVMEARDYGSFAARERIYIVASSLGPSDSGTAFLRFLLACQTHPGSRVYSGRPCKIFGALFDCGISRCRNFEGELN